MKLKPNENMKLAVFYAANYPSDKETAAEMNQENTFKDLFRALDEYQDVYDVIGVDDSIVRERLFEGLSDVSGMTYDEIYEQWLKG